MKPTSLALGEGRTVAAGRSSLGLSPISPTESARDLLLQKRVSLTHTPDIVRVFERDCQTSEQIHEFQKVPIQGMGGTM